jgi:hypothetical protein
MFNAVEELLDNNSIVFLGILKPFIKAWRWMATPSSAIFGSGSLKIRGLLREQTILNLLRPSHEKLYGMARRMSRLFMWTLILRMWLKW